MPTERRILAISSIAALAALAVLVLFPADTVKRSAVPMGPVEVRGYDGEMLSAISDFRENSIRGPQQVSEETYRLKITGLVDSPQEHTYDEVLAHDKYSKVVTLFCVEGWEATILWEGFRVADLLDEAGVKPEANTVIFHAYDGYTTSLPLDYIRNRGIIVAYKMNGVALPPERGFPLQLVAEDKWGYKWIKWVTEIELSSDPDYKGYWESRGYSNSGDLPGGY